MPKDDNKKSEAHTFPIYSINIGSKYTLYPTTKESEMHLQANARDFRNWHDSEVERRDKSDKISKTPPPDSKQPDQKIRTISFDEHNIGSGRKEIINKMERNLAMQSQVIQEASTSWYISKDVGTKELRRIRDDSKPPQALKKETKSRKGSLPPKKCTFTDLTKNDDNKKSIG